MYRVIGTNEDNLAVHGDKLEVSKQLLIFLNTYLSKYFKQIKFLKIAYIVKINERKAIF